MTSYENEIMDLIPGETPKQKFDYIKNLIWLNSPEQEVALLNVIYDLKNKGKQMYASSGSESYTERCALFDIEKKIYHLTNKCKIDKVDFWSFLSSLKPNKTPKTD